MKSYNSKLSVVGDIEMGKTYFKNNMPLGWPPILFHEIKIISENGTDVDVKVNGEATAQTIKKTEALLYINCRDGYSDTK